MEALAVYLNRYAWMIKGEQTTQTRVQVQNSSLNAAMNQ
jgi:hypothetical protein